MKQEIKIIICTEIDVKVQLDEDLKNKIKNEINHLFPIHKIEFKVESEFYNLK